MVFRESFISRRLSRASVMGRLGPFFPLDEATLAKMGSLARTRSNCLSLLTLLDEGAAACPPPAAAPALASRVALVCRRRHSFTAQVQAPRRFAQEFVMIVQGVGGRDRMESIRQIFWCPGLRVSEVLELEWRDLDYSGEPPTLLVRKSKSPPARTVRLHADLVQLFANWPANRVPRDKVVALAMRTALRHIGDGIEWASLDQEPLGTGKRRAGAHSLRHSAARPWLVAGRVPLNVVSSWLGHTNVQVTLRIYLPIVGSDYGMDDVP